MIDIIKKGLGLVRFKIFQQHIWNFLLNRNDNRFLCRGRLINCSINIRGSRNYIEINKDVKLNNVRITITGNGHTLIIGRGTIWTEWGWIRMEDENNSIFIGENGDFRGCFFTCSDKNTKINIGQECLFSANVVIRTSDSHSVISESGTRINPGKNVEIGRHVWIGNNAIILKGSNIGENSIIGTMAVVGGKMIPAGSIAVGNPAKIVHEGG